MSTLYDHTDYLLRNHPAIRLLRKDTAALILAFCQTTFGKQRRATYGGRELTGLLTDLLFSLNDGGQTYPRPARDYLESWTEEGFLRQTYGREAEEVTFELSAATEQALQWLAELDRPEFIGAESRLKQLFDQLRQLAENTTEEVAVRRRQLEARRAEVDAQLDALERGELARLTETGIRERFHLIEDTAVRLRGDFRAIEDNFRRLNAAARAELMREASSRGEVLADIFDSRDRILDTDQGRTFTAFWEFLMNQDRREEQETYLTQIFALPELSGLRQNSILPQLETNLVDASDRVNRITHRLIGQLRRFVQSRAFSEHHRVAAIITRIERLAVAVKATPPPHRGFATIEGTAAVNLTMDRSPFMPPPRLELPACRPTVGDTTAVVTTALYNRHYVDPAELRGRLDALLRHRTQISLGEVAREIPPKRGLSELLTYYHIATQWESDHRARIDPSRPETITYNTANGKRTATFPETIFLHE